VTSVPIRWRNAIYATNGRILSWRAKAVAGPISIHMAKDGGSIRPSIERLAAEASLSPRTVHTGLAELREAGFLVVERQGGGRHRPTVYRAEVPSQTVHVMHRFAANTAHRVQGLQPETLHVRPETLHVGSENHAPRAEEDVQESVQEDAKPIPRANARGKKRARSTRSSREQSSADWEGVENYDHA
jgi:DNA-binding transcriptional ArsR family regulator